MALISVEEARRIVMAQATAPKSTHLPLCDSAGRVLTGDVRAPFPHPLFDMSAVDGYAVGDAHGPWAIVGRITAGKVMDRMLNTGECARIFTGAQVPLGAHGVLMQEHCTTKGTKIQSVNGQVAQGANIRRMAEQCAKGDLLLSKGARLDPAGIGYLASCGVEKVAVALAPRVAVVRTGGEFIVGNAPVPGRIFSSNEMMLIGALRLGGFSTDDDAYNADDTEEDLILAVRRASAASDAVITTGGASVGDHDLILTVLKNLGARIHFHGVAQKPGKPMLFATLMDVPVFALPGNPRAVMVCYWEYVLPFLRALGGDANPGLRSDHFPLSHEVSIRGERAEFRAAEVRRGRVSLLPDEGSHMLRTLVQADALAYLPASKNTWGEGEIVEVHYLPHR